MGERKIFSRCGGVGGALRLTKWTIFRHAQGLGKSFHHFVLFTFRLNLSLFYVGTSKTRANILGHFIHFKTSYVTSSFSSCRWRCSVFLVCPLPCLIRRCTHAYIHEGQAKSIHAHNIRHRNHFV